MKTNGMKSYVIKTTKYEIYDEYHKELWSQHQGDLPGHPTGPDRPCYLQPNRTNGVGGPKWWTVNVTNAQKFATIEDAKATRNTVLAQYQQLIAEATEEERKTGIGYSHEPPNMKIEVRETRGYGREVA